ncbi:TraI domain-containing protein [Pseudomonas sp. AO-1]|uniref:TraI domain-containing protein n=1 Tax=Pseudomonas sp. AO-1 TaxID=2855434 RepID=UPI001C74B584|nr:TraI domain-containing protein [Pseudomonas sp. AO-1]QXZ13541.1 TraI domain-containing protein [Pseudomonas sp. AO-1]
MFSLFHRKLRRALDPTAAANPTSRAGQTNPQCAESLLAAPRRQKLLRQIWQCTAISRSQFDELYLDPIRRYAELVQLLPASESQRQAYSGGMLDHGLEVVTYALKIRRSRLLPQGAPSEVQIIQTEAWNAALAYASLGGNLGKIAIDLQVEYLDGCAWHPWHGPLTRPYRVRYRKDLDYRLRGPASSLMIHQLLSGEILDWLSAFPELWASLIAHWSGHSEHTGAFGAIIIQAEQALVANAPAQTTTAAESDKPAIIATQSDPSLSDKTSTDYLDSLTNQIGEFPKWPEGSDSVPITESALSVEGPSEPDKHAKPSGEHFIEWLIESVRTHEIIMNDDRALVHCVEDTLFLVTPGIFQRYAQALPHLASISKSQGQHGWEGVQRRFGKMKLHRIQANGRSIWTCELSSARRTRLLHGYLLKKHYGLVSDSSLNNPRLKVVTPSSAEPHTTLGNTRQPVSGLTANVPSGIFAMHLADSFSTSRQDLQGGAAVLRRIHRMTA